MNQPKTGVHVNQLKGVYETAKDRHARNIGTASWNKVLIMFKASILVYGSSKHIHTHIMFKIEL